MWLLNNMFSQAKTAQNAMQTATEYMYMYMYM